MKLLLVHQYFKLPEEGRGIRSWHIARSWVEKGHKVTVLTTSNERSGTDRIDGVEVIYLPVRYENSFGFIRRIFSFFQFVIACRKFLKRNHDFDLAYVLTTPLTTAFIALFLKKKLGIDYIFEVGDIWPGVPIELGIIKNTFLKSYLLNLEERAYQNAKKLVALSPAIRDHMQQIAPEREITVIPNMSDCRFFYPSKASDPLKICYYGAISYANHVEFYLEAAKYSLKENLPLEFHIMGFGGMKNLIHGQSARLQNVFWHNEGGMNAVRELLKTCHATYISYLNHPILTTGSPNKLFDGLASGHLIITNFKGWIGELIEEKGCGFFYDPEKPEEFGKRISEYILRPERLMECQKRARELAEKEFEVEKLTAKLNAFLDF